MVCSKRKAESEEEAQDHGQLQWHADALANSGPPAAVNHFTEKAVEIDIMRNLAPLNTKKMVEAWCTDGPDFGRTRATIDAYLSDIQTLGVKIVADNQKPVERAAACLWRMREAAIAHLQKPTALTRDHLKAVVDEPPFESLAAIKREAAAAFFMAADDQGGYGSHESRVWMDDNIDTFFQ
jgi:hypothetical protein